MNEREQFEAWFRKATAPANKFGYDQEELWWSWQACAESKQAELDKANARVAQLEGCLNQIAAIRPQDVEGGINGNDAPHVVWTKYRQAILSRSRT